MATIFIRHKARDFTAWKAAYAAFDAERNTMGGRRDGVYRSADDLSEVTLYQNFDDAGAAQSFADSARLKEMMSGASILGIPDVWITESSWRDSGNRGKADQARTIRFGVSGDTQLLNERNRTVPNLPENHSRFGRRLDRY